jgi:uncharacterized Zn-binding protein involved in type VI secretion
MKRACINVCAVMCLVAFSYSCVAQGNPWNGSWKLDPSSVKYDGVLYSIKTDADGYTFSSGGTASPKTVCDGKPHAVDGGLMLTCNKVGTGYTSVATKEGKVIRKSEITVSADGKTLTRKRVTFPADGSSYTMTITSKKMPGGSGSTVMWKEVKVDETAETGVLSIKVDGGNVAFKETDQDKPTVCKLDGTPTKLSMGGTMAVVKADAHTLKVTYKGDDGKVRRENTFVVSPDGKTVKETDVTPSPMASTTSMVLKKV